MNPLDLHGPEFLAFYTLFAIATCLALLWWRSRREAGGPGPGRLNDPYRIAYLRGGDPEMRRVAAIALVDRGLLRVEGTQLVTAPEAAEATDHPLERALLVHFARAREARDLYDASPAIAIALEHHDALARQGLLPDAALRAARAWRAALAILALLSLASAKIAVAFSRGHHNVLFLLVLANLAAFVAWRISRPRLTRRGRQVLADLRILFAGLRHPERDPRPETGAPDARLLAAVFGIGTLAALPGFAYAQALFPRATTLGSSSSSSCGSSCGSASSCGGGGGGGCGGGGGGGCGGGCGGCGS
jgi:uncharacterized protein (TIGR04222 family)